MPHNYKITSTQELERVLFVLSTPFWKEHYSSVSELQWFWHMWKAEFLETLTLATGFGIEMLSCFSNGFEAGIKITSEGMQKVWSEQDMSKTTHGSESGENLLTQFPS